MTVVIQDWREKRVGPVPRGYCKMLDGKPFVRRISDITGVMLHQTGLNFGPADLKKKEFRAFKVQAHAIAWGHGTGCLINPLRWYVNHGNGLNVRSLGLEEEGSFHGVEGDERTLWRKPASVKTQLREDTLIATFDALVVAALEEGAPLQWLWSHRQSNGGKPSDPGEYIWRTVSKYAEQKFGMKPQFDFTVDDGRPIPKKWDERATAKY